MESDDIYIYIYIRINIHTYIYIYYLSNKYFEYYPNSNDEYISSRDYSLKFDYIQ